MTDHQGVVFNSSDNKYWLELGKGMTTDHEEAHRFTRMEVTMYMGGNPALVFVPTGGNHVARRQT